MNRKPDDIGSALAYYLGSKRRMAGEVVDCVRDMQTEGRVLDLFSGMGSVSVALSKSFPVTAVDVQEYSRAMCSALIVGDWDPNWSASDVQSEYEAARARLYPVFAGVIEYEKSAIEAFRLGEGRPLSDIVEHGCMLPEYRKVVPGDLKRLMGEADQRQEAVRSYDVPIRYYGGSFFSYEQAVDLAAIRIAADAAPAHMRDVTIAALICAASHCASTVGGQFAQPLKTIDGKGALKQVALDKAYAARQKNVFEAFLRAIDEIKAIRLSRPENEAVRGECVSYLDTHAVRVGAIYADPPYSRYHYSRYYHVLETLALGDQPTITANPATKAPSRGVYRANRYQSPFSMRSSARKGFEHLFAACASVSDVLVLSYSPFPENKKATPRMMTVDGLVEVAKDHYKSIEVSEVEGVVHSKLANSKDVLDAAENAEVLIVCKN